MNVVVSFDAVLLGSKVDRNDRGTFYSIGVDCDGSVGNLSCTPELYDLVRDAVKYSPYTFEGTYNSDYKRLKVTKVKL